MNNENESSPSPTPSDIAAYDFAVGWKNYAEEVYAIGKASGFYDKPHTASDFNHSEKLLLMVSEICEGMEGMRGAEWPGIADDKLTHRAMLEVELADAVIRSSLPAHRDRSASRNS